MTNPNSGANKTQLQKINRLVDRQPHIRHYITRSAGEIPEVLATLHEDGTNTLAINGGDGTTAAVFTSLLQGRLFDRLPNIVLLPGGTTNMNVGDIGIRGKLTKGIQRLCDPDFKHRARRVARPVLSIQQGAGLPTINGMFFGAGAIIQGIEFCHDSVHSRGVGSEVGPGIAMLRTIWGIIKNDPLYANPVPMKIAYSSQADPVVCETLLLLCSTLERLLLGMRPYWGKEDGAIYSTLIKTQPDQFLRSLPFLLTGKPTQRLKQSDSYHSKKTQSIEIHMNSRYTLDGEIYATNDTTGPITVSATEPLSFLR
ncbi:MAG: diacylglycerol kinase family protein [Gammaproteobacteria bacterium]